MLSYATLLLASLGVLLAVTLIYKTTRLIYRSVSKSRSSSKSFNAQAKLNRRSSLKSQGAISSAVNDSLAPLQRSNHKTSWNHAKLGAVNTDVNSHQDFAWLKREKASALSENSYTVKRRFTPKAPTLESVSKPFKRKVAPWVLEYGNQSKSSTHNTGAK